MQVPGSANALMLGGAKDYTIARSLRFRSSASAYLSRQQSVASNRTTWTFSTWVKRGSLAVTQPLYWGSNAVNSEDGIRFNATSDVLNFYIYNASGYVGQLQTTQAFRDTSAWYHIVCVWNTTDATASNRMKIYVNGVQVTSFTTASYPSQNAVSDINNNVYHYVGRLNSSFYDGYIAETQFIDGQALTPSSFGETDLTNGVWKPKKYSGAYGGTSFYLPFSDNSSTTNLCLDKSGSSNHWTPNNISVTAGATYDSMTDVPTLTSKDAANYCTLNPLHNAGTLSEANLKWTGSNQSTHGTIAVSSGKYYFEVKVDSFSTGNGYIGISDDSWDKVDGSWGWNQIFAYVTDGRAGGNGAAGAYGATYTAGDIIGIAFDITSNTIAFYKNGTSQGTAFSTGLLGKNWRPLIYFSASSGATANFGQRPFAYTPPTGFVALNTFNLPDPTIKKPASNFDVSTYTGTGTTLAVTNSGAMQPDFVWMKARSYAPNHALVDVLRGASWQLQTSTNNAESQNSAGKGLQSFNSNGFTLGQESDAIGGTNRSGDTYVAWQWKANGAGSSNTAGSVNSVVSANAAAGFSIATFTSPSTGNFTFGHGLGVAPKMVIIKPRASVGSWIIYHASVMNATTQYLVMNSTIALANYGGGIWGSALPSSTVVGLTVGGSVSPSDTNLAYCFSEVAGYSKFGSYTGNGSADGTFVHCGFKPKFVLVKCTSTTGNWYLLDATRDTDNGVDSYLMADTSGAEGTGTVVLDFLSNGFKLRNAGVAVNGSGSTYIFAAFAENPFKYSLAR